MDFKKIFTVKNIVLCLLMIVFGVLIALLTAFLEPGMMSVGLIALVLFVGVGLMVYLDWLFDKKNNEFKNSKSVEVEGKK